MLDSYVLGMQFAASLEIVAVANFLARFLDLSSISFCLDRVVVSNIDLAEFYVSSE
jgi:hypothetical protein